MQQNNQNQAALENQGGSSTNRISVQYSLIESIKQEIMVNKVSKQLQSHLDLLCDTSEIQNLQEQKVNSLKFRDKLAYVSNMFCLLAFFFLIGYSPSYAFVIFYCVLTLLALISRSINFFSTNQFLYLLEFCYFANLLSIVFFIYFPQNRNVWFAVWTSDCGVIALAMVILKNKIALTSNDTMIGLFIHAAPPAAAWSVRWRQILYNGDNHNYFNLLDQNDLDLDQEIFKQMIYSGSIFYVCWMIFYIFVFHLLCYKIVNNPEKYRSCLKDIEVIQKYSQFQQRVIYSFLHLICYIIGMLFSIFLYSYFYIHTAYLIILYIIIFWNGGTYYVDHFSKKYIKKIEKIGLDWANNKIKK